MQINQDWNELMSRGKQAGREANPSAALDFFQRAYDISRTFPENDVRRAESAQCLGFTKFVAGNKGDAVPLLEEAIRIFRSSGINATACAQMLSLLAGIAHEGKDAASAENHARSALQIAADAGAKSWEMTQMLVSALMVQQKYAEVVPELERLLGYHRDVLPGEVPNTITMLAYANRELGDKAGELRWKKELLREKENRSPIPLPHIELSGTYPEGWGTDRVSHFIESARLNEFATFQQRPSQYTQLLAVDERFWSSRRNLALQIADVIDAKPDKPFADIVLDDEEWLEVYFFLRCQASFFGALRLAISAQGPEAYMALRGCLENALYANHCKGSSTIKKIWLNRHASEADYKKCRDEFGNTAVIKSLTKASPLIGTKAKFLYDDTIDKGAHPNVKVFLSNAFQTNENGEIRLGVMYLNPDELDGVLTATEQVGGCALEIFSVVFPNLID